MTEKEYDDKLKGIDEAYNNAKYQLYKEFVMSNAKFKIGDIIRWSDVTILVDKITVSMWGSYPNAIYHGVELKKDLTPKLNGNRGSVFYRDDIELLTKK